MNFTRYVRMGSSLCAISSALIACRAKHDPHPDVRPDEPPLLTEGARIAKPIEGMKHALAIPLGKTGAIEIVLTNHAATCQYLTDRVFEQGCNVWRSRITLPPKAQKPGRYPVGEAFAYLDRRALGPGGAWLDRGVCENIGNDLHGELEITNISRDTIEGRISNSSAVNPRSKALLDGSFVAKRCPACMMTGDDCKQHSDCCTNLCSSGGHCSP